MKNKLLILFLSFLLVSSVLFLSFKLVSASSVTIAQYTGGQDNTPMVFTDYKIGEAFNCSVTSRLITASFELRIHGSPTGSISCILASANGGTYGTNILPNNIIVMSNYQYFINALTSNYQWINFTFSNIDTVLTANTKYVMYIQVFDYSHDGSNYVEIHNKDSGSNYEGNDVRSYSAGSWFADVEDINFIIIGDTDLTTPTPTPTPSSTPTPSPTPSPSPTPEPTLVFPTATPTLAPNFINSVLSNIMLIVYLIIGFFIFGIIAYIYLLIRRKK